MDTSAAKRPVVALLAESGRAVGLGHVRRSLALAQALAPWADCRLLLHGDTGAAVPGHRPGVSCLPVGDIEGVFTVLRTIGAAALVVDSYAVSTRELEQARTRVRLLVAMDDTASFPLPAHVVVNSALGVDPPWPDNGTLYLLGARYALLAPEFAEPPVRSHGQVRRILLVLGAATCAPLMAVLAGAARRAVPTVSLDVVVGPLGDDPEVMRRALADVGGATTLHVAPESIRPLMLDADLAVTAGGVTLCELAATGTPAVGVCLAQNQEANLVGLDRAGALRFAGYAEDPGLPLAVEGVLAELAADAARRRELSERARHLVDGRGAFRVAQVMRERLGEASLGAGNRAC